MLMSEYWDVYDKFRNRTNEFIQEEGKFLVTIQKKIILEMYGNLKQIYPKKIFIIMMEK